MTEHDLQSSIIAECAYRANQDGNWGLIFAIPNGGKRSKATAGRLKAEGVKAGVPDLFLPLARNGYHGLFLELKVSPNKRERVQSLWHVRLMEQGYSVHTVWDDATEAIRILESYINGDADTCLPS